MRSDCARLFQCFCLAIANIVLCVACTQQSIAQEAATKVEDAATTDEPTIDPFTVPDGSADAIIEFMQGLSKLKPEEGQDRNAFIKKLTETMRDSADALLKKKPDEQELTLGNRVLLISLERLAEMGDQQAAKRLPKEVARAKASKVDGIASLGWQFQLVGQLESWEDLNEKSKQDFVKKTLKQMQEDGFRPVHAQLLQMTSEALQDIDPKYAGAVLRGSIDLMKRSDNPQLRNSVGRLEGTLRRMELPGNQMEVFGTLLSDEKVDWKSYRGKVVLVDYWATWCGPCRDEVPNLLKMYDAYHEKGFEVLGISLDETAEDAQSYIDDMDIPWATIFSKKEADRGWNNPMARHYGISGIPTAILVDRDGKVVHMNARGRNLRAKLQELLGDPIEKAKPEDKD
ncbi:TlpA family protein disulfide reductase [Adhaeretor mobilis]|uniref:Thiol-disulfide oxidoreductase ResA n=1 Tax=Adhaeretor mobilis TaxID=1930276 RepID=A0A517MRK2_9BACT|nr:TlpA disulfide reductase family protein [Adhaeretor mobilis]QDS97417.1 Thiol-disulfide oxidoreductase ResA [Adhaeretor mobilis]